MPTNKITYGQIWPIAYPILISLLMEHTIGLTDTAFLGRVGEVELGASALAGVYYMAFYMLAFGFSIGAQILIGRRNGEERQGEIGALFQQGVLFMLLLAGMLFAVSKVFSPLILRNLIASEHVFEATIKFLDWRVYGFFFAFGSAMFRAFYVGITRTRILTLNAVVMVLSNVVLNYTLIFGKFGFPAMGIAGSAVASVVAEAVSLVFFIVYTWAKADHRRYNLFGFARFVPRLLSRMLNLSVWTMLQAFISVTTWFLFFVAMEHLGERPLAISNIVRSVSTMLFMFINAFGSTTSTLVTNLMGADRSTEVMATCRRIIRLNYMILLPLIALIALFPTAAIRIYTDDPELIAASVPSLLVMLGVYVFYVPGSVYFSAVSGTGNTRPALVMELATLTVYVLYILYVVVYLRADVAVGWTAEYAYAVVLLIITYRYMKKANWQSKKI